MAKISKTTYLIIGGVLLAFFFFGISPQEIKTVEGGWDISGQIEGYEEYLYSASDIDVTHPEIQAKAKEIKSTTSTPKEAVQKTIRYVAQHTRYTSGITINYCYNERASDVLESGIGDCVSMARLDVALFRAMGIPARTVGGCLSSRIRCLALFATVPYLEAQTTAMIEGDFKKRGFLHEWAEVYLPGEGWLLIEATSGQAFDIGCETYLIYSYDTNQYNRCTINDQSFWEECYYY